MGSSTDERARRRAQIPLPRRGSQARRVNGADGGGDARDTEPQGTCTVDEAIVDCALYEHGKRQGGRVPFAQAMETARSSDEGFVWIGMHDPNAETLEALGQEFDLHPLAVEDAVYAHQRPKLERHGDGAFFFVLKTARYVDADELVDIGEIMVFLGDHYVVTVRHGEGSALHEVRTELESHPSLLKLGPISVLYAVLDRVVDDYAEVAEGLSVDVSEIEAQVFGGQGDTNPTQRIYLLKREVLEFKRAVTPLVSPLQRLVEAETSPLNERSRPYFRDVLDHLLRDEERVTGLDEMLTSALNANFTLIALRDNEDMRKMSAWAAIGIVPTVIFGLYGMNFDHMPELKWTFGYPLVLALTFLVCFGLYRRFKRVGWL